MRSIDGFSMHKEVKIFFVGEEAQDAGGVFKEWLNLLLTKIFSGYEGVKEKDYSEDMVTLQKGKSGVRLKDYNPQMRKTLKTQLENAEEGIKPQSEICSMMSEDIARGRDRQLNKEESKGKRSSSEEVIKAAKIDEKIVKVPYMKGVRVGEGIGNEEMEYFYHFGDEIPDEIAKLLGKVIGKAIFEGVPITPRLNRFILKCMLSQDFELDDLSTYDPGMLNSVKYIMENDFNPTDLYLTFGFIDEKKYGDEQLVTNKNKNMFVEILLNYYGYLKHLKTTNAFLEALYSVVPADLLKLLSIEDIEKLLVGARTIDINDWRMHTRVTGCSLFNGYVVNWFWEIMKQLNDRELRRFLQFCTGCQSVPIEGFCSLKNNRQESCPFTIRLMESEKGMIRAHTCFNRIELPLFRNKEDLQENIQYILNQNEFVFDFE